MVVVLLLYSALFLLFVQHSSGSMSHRINQHEQLVSAVVVDVAVAVAVFAVFATGYLQKESVTCCAGK